VFKLDASYDLHYDCKNTSDIRNLVASHLDVDHLILMLVDTIESQQHQIDRLTARGIECMLNEIASLNEANKDLSRQLNRALR